MPNEFVAAADYQNFPAAQPQLMYVQAQLL